MVGIASGRLPPPLQGSFLFAFTQQTFNSQVKATKKTAPYSGGYAHQWVWARLETIRRIHNQALKPIESQRNLLNLRIHKHVFLFWILSHYDSLGAHRELRMTTVAHQISPKPPNPYHKCPQIISLACGFAFRNWNLQKLVAPGNPENWDHRATLLPYLEAVVSWELPPPQPASLKPNSWVANTSILPPTWSNCGNFGPAILPLDWSPLP